MLSSELSASPFRYPWLPCCARGQPAARANFKHGWLHKASSAESQLVCGSKHLGKWQPCLVKSLFTKCSSEETKNKSQHIIARYIYIANHISLTHSVITVWWKFHYNSWHAGRAFPSIDQYFYDVLQQVKTILMTYRVFNFQFLLSMWQKWRNLTSALTTFDTLKSEAVNTSKLQCLGGYTVMLLLEDSFVMSTLPNF